MRAWSGERGQASAVRQTWQEWAMHGPAGTRDGHVDAPGRVDKLVGLHARPHAGEQHDLALRTLEGVDRRDLHGRGLRGRFLEQRLHPLDLRFVCRAVGEKGTLYPGR